MGCKCGRRAVNVGLSVGSKCGLQMWAVSVGYKCGL